MVLRPDVVYKAIQAARKSKVKNQKSKVILLSPAGKVFTQKMARELASADHLIFVSGRYEGFDHRITEFVDVELSIGDYVLMGGELPALVISEAVLRNVPGVLGKDESASDETFSNGLLEYPQYTKPVEWKVVREGGKGREKREKAEGKKSVQKTLKVPAVLLTGHHGNIAAWRKAESEKRTKKIRPDLYKNTTATAK
jgi:tRNA (guanine37-N1)-methyltransferase